MLGRISDNLPFGLEAGFLNVYLKEPEQKAQACVIWMHGLGADANDMRGLATALPLSHPITHIFLEAPMRPITLFQNMPARAWYNLGPDMPQHSQDWPQTSESEQTIRAAIQQQIDQGVNAACIFLA